MAGGVETIEGTAGVQGDLWSERARDWAEVMEGWTGWGIPVYRQVLERLRVGTGQYLLDIGCGAGRLCRIAADRGAQVSGIDAAAPLVEIARE
jgi:2-polyprenyl-3-methyl-5-hydroxy-6-metoxy-1,4-benzoquinol methylase